VSSTAEPPQGAKPARPAGLIPHFNTLQATALNMSNMVGIGPFMTIPLLMSAVNNGGPQAMLGWVIALLIVIPDGMIWSELGAAMPGSGGTYVYLREGFGRQTFGRLMAFLFIWQFIVSGPLEIASGYVGFAKYLRFVRNDLSTLQISLIAALVGIVNITLLYRKITHIGKITVSLWIGTLLTMGAVIITGVRHFDASLAFDFPPDAFRIDQDSFVGLGLATTIGVYDYLGYYDICYIGDEVKNPGRVIPRSIFLSVVAVAIAYFAINLSIIGIVPWREFVPADKKPVSDFVVSFLMNQVYGRPVAIVFTFMVLWTAFGSAFALLLGYSRIPYAAARDGNFFQIFGRLHPTKSFPHVSLLTIGAVSVAGSFFSLETLINALVVTRILVQFIGQIFAVHFLRKRSPGMPRPYKIWLYPLPSVVALLGWLFLFATSKPLIILFGLGSLALGVVCFCLWSWQKGEWPFRPATGSPGSESPSSGSGDKSRSG